MATPSLDYQNFYSSTLSSTITAADTTIYLDTLPTPSEGYLVIEPDSSTNREIIYYTSKGANFVTVPTSGGRGVGGTTAVAHSSGATVNMNNVAEMWTAIKDGSANTGMHQWFDESFADYVYSGGTIGVASGLIASISSGVVYINGRRLTLNSASKTFTASKDTYVDVVALSGSNTATLSYTELASGATGSTPVSNGMHIGMVRSSASAIATIQQTFTDTLGNPLKPTSPVTAVGIHNPYKFSVYRNSAYNWGTNVFAKISHDVKLFDTNGNYDTSTSKYTVPVSGYYYLSSNVYTPAAVGGNFYITAIYRNGSQFITGSGSIAGAGTSGFNSVASECVQLNAGDYLEVYAYGTGNSGSAGQIYTNFSGFLISRT